MSEDIIRLIFGYLFYYGAPIGMILVVFNKIKKLIVSNKKGYKKIEGKVVEYVKDTDEKYMNYQKDALLEKHPKFYKKMMSIAEKYDVEGDSVYQRAINKMQLELNDKTKFNSLVYTDLKINYILLPFYFSQNNEGQLLVNGQSGEMSYNAITLETDRKKSKYIRKIHKVKLAEKMNLVDLLFFISLFGCIISLGISWLVKELLPMMSQIFFIIGGILGIIILIYVKFERFL